jgi:hypothetical protein
VKKMKTISSIPWVPARFAAAAVVLLAWFSSATDEEREAISAVKRTFRATEENVFT